MLHALQNGKSCWFDAFYILKFLKSNFGQIQISILKTLLQNLFLEISIPCNDISMFLCFHQCGNLFDVCEIRILTVFWTPLPLDLLQSLYCVHVRGYQSLPPISHWIYKIEKGWSKIQISWFHTSKFCQMLLP